MRVDARRTLVEPEHARLSIARQCELLGLARSSYYYKAVTESPENLRLMRLIDEQYTKRPFYGVEKMTGWLREDKGELVNPKRVRRLMRLMGIEAIYPKPRLSQGNAEHRIYPYLPRDVKIERPNQVWSTDIYIKDYEDVPALLQGVGNYLDFYNGERRHQSLGNRTPGSVYFQAA